MANTPAASGNLKRAAPSALKGTSSGASNTDIGIELSAALPPVAPPSCALSADANAPQFEPEPEPGAAAGSAPAPAPESAAGHLAGSSPAVVGEMDAKFARLVQEVHQNRPGDDLDIIRQAWQFGLQHHEGQKRASGEPYVVHPLEVALVLAELKMDSTAIAAGLLHDAVEDTDVTTGEIEKRFGEQVAHIVEGVTKLDKIKFANREDHQAENIRKMLLAMVTDVRVVIIKLADRLHNMRTLEHLPSEKRQKIARETLDIFAPLAHRLGMGKLRGELEDLAFRYTDPFTYEQLSNQVENLRGANEEFLAGIVKEIEQILAKNNIKGRVESRIKRLYSIQEKLSSQKITVDQVHDVLAVRVICQSKDDCWIILGLLRSEEH